MDPKVYIYTGTLPVACVCVSRTVVSGECLLSGGVEDGVSWRGTEEVTFCGMANSPVWAAMSITASESLSCPPVTGAGRSGVVQAASIAGSEPGSGPGHPTQE